MEHVVISVPADQVETSKVSLLAIRAIAAQGAEVVLSGPIKPICRQAMESLGIQVVADMERMTVRQAIALYTAEGRQALAHFRSQPVKVAVASHGESLEDTLSPKGSPCTSFVLVDPQTMAYEIVRVKPAESIERASVNAVRAAARSGATVVITPEIRPACCEALRSLAITVALADPECTVRQAIQQYLSGELSSPPSL
jgi:predicted Fe-Mo cluster-binding NifX family protein